MSKFFPLRVTPRFEVIKVKNKNDFFYLSEGMENVKCHGKIREKSGNHEVDDKWQPWFNLLKFCRGKFCCLLFESF